MFVHFKWIHSLLFAIYWPWEQVQVSRWNQMFIYSNEPKCFFITQHVWSYLSLLQFFKRKWKYQNMNCKHWIRGNIQTTRVEEKRVFCAPCKGTQNNGEAERTRWGGDNLSVWSQRHVSSQNVSHNKNNKMLLCRVLGSLSLTIVQQGSIIKIACLPGVSKMPPWACKSRNSLLKERIQHIVFFKGWWWKKVRSEPSRFFLTSNLRAKQIKD